MSLDSSNALADLIKRIADGVGVDVQQPSKGTAHAVTVTYSEQSLTFTFDQGGKVPDAADCISALWSRAAVINRGEDEAIVVVPKGDYEEWKQCAEDAWRVFGDWFGRRWE